jgi:hypothetical protein
MTKVWDCVAVSCPSCDAEPGQRCQPRKQRSMRKEVDYPHVARLRKHRRTGAEAPLMENAKLFLLARFVKRSTGDRG